MKPEGKTWQPGVLWPAPTEGTWDEHSLALDGDWFDPKTRALLRCRLEQAGRREARRSRERRKTADERFDENDDHYREWRNR